MFALVEVTVSISMASRQVLRFCKRIEQDVGIVCNPESFHVERFNQPHHVWNMVVDVEKSTGLSDNAKSEMYDPVYCTSAYYMKDLLQFKKKLSKRVTIDEGEVELFPNKEEYR